MSKMKVIKLQTIRTFKTLSLTSEEVDKYNNVLCQTISVVQKRKLENHGSSRPVIKNNTCRSIVQRSFCTGRSIVIPGLHFQISWTTIYHIRQRFSFLSTFWFFLAISPKNGDNVPVFISFGNRWTNKVFEQEVRVNDDGVRSYLQVRPKLVLDLLWGGLQLLDPYFYIPCTVLSELRPIQNNNFGRHIRLYKPFCRKFFQSYTKMRIACLRNTKNRNVNTSTSKSLWIFQNCKQFHRRYVPIESPSTNDKKNRFIKGFISSF